MTDTTAGGFFASLEAELESAFNTVVTDAEALAVAIGTEVENDVKALWATLAPVALTAIQQQASLVVSGQARSTLRVSQRTAIDRRGATMMALPQAEPTILALSPKRRLASQASVPCDVR